MSPFVELVREETKIICVKKKKLRPVIASWGLAFTEQSTRELSGVLVMFCILRGVWVVLMPESPDCIFKFCAFHCM